MYFLFIASIQNIYSKLFATAFPKENPNEKPNKNQNKFNNPFSDLCINFKRCHQSISGRVSEQWWDAILCAVRMRAGMQNKHGW